MLGEAPLASTVRPVGWNRGFSFEQQRTALTGTPKDLNCRHDCYLGMLRGYLTAVYACGRARYCSSSSILYKRRSSDFNGYLNVNGILGKNVRP